MAEYVGVHHWKVKPFKYRHLTCHSGMETERNAHVPRRSTSNNYWVAVHVTLVFSKF